MKLNWRLIHLTNEHIYNGRLNWHRGIPPPPPPRARAREDGDGEDEEQQIPRIPDWDFSHLDRIIETVPSVESASFFPAPSLGDGKKVRR